jgi:hypothetical protein
VEEIAGPLVTTCGMLDGIWPSCAFAAAIHRRRVAHEVGRQDLDLQYPAAGHLVGASTPYLSLASTTVTLSTGLTIVSGGTVEDTLAASADAYGHVLARLETLT